MKPLLYLLATGLVLTGLLYAAPAPSFSATLGGDFFNYEDGFLDISGAYIVPLRDELELSLSAAFAISTEERKGGTEAVFYLPFDLGLNFIFPAGNRLEYLLGAGVTPQFLFTDEDRFYLGPFIKGGVRIRTHEYMQWVVELQQDLLIGPPDWINTASRVRSGIIFSFDAP